MDLVQVRQFGGVSLGVRECLSPWWRSTNGHHHFYHVIVLPLLFLLLLRLLLCLLLLPQVHPTAFSDVPKGFKAPKDGSTAPLILCAEILRGVGGVLLDRYLLTSSSCLLPSLLFMPSLSLCLP